MDHRIGAAGLGLAAFSGTLDALHSLKALYLLFQSLQNSDKQILLIRTRLLLQQDLLEHWKRDWYGFGVADHISIGRLRLLREHDSTARSILQAVQALLIEAAPLAKSQSGREGMSALEKVKWVALQKVTATEAVANADSLLAGLYRLLPPRSPDINTALMVLSMQQSPDASMLQSISQTLQLDSAPPVIKQTLGLRSLQEQLTVSLTERILKHQQSQGDVSLEIKPPGRVSKGTLDPNSVGSRSFGTLDGKSAVIEWKPYDSNWQGQKGIELRGRIDNLARLLNADTKPDELMTLKCQGYFDDMENARYGFVFTYPGSGEGRFYSLRELIDQPTAETLPTLGQRYQMAYSISITIAILHTSEWLHKSIRSHNILFHADTEHIGWGRPCLMGFEYSRPDKPDQSSEKPGQSARFNVYRHPLSQGSPNESYRRSFDIYSFGVVLFEIGMWRAVWKLWKDGMAPEEFRNELLRDVNSKKLAHMMGVEFRDATFKCLTGELEELGTPELKAFFIEVVEVLGRCLMDA